MRLACFQLMVDGRTGHHGQLFKDINKRERDNVTTLFQAVVEGTAMDQALRPEMFIVSFTSYLNIKLYFLQTFNDLH